MELGVPLKSRLPAYIAGIITCISLSVSAYYITTFLRAKQQKINDVQQAAQQQTITAAQELNNFISMIQPIAQELANELGTKTMSAQELEQRLTQKPIEIFGLGVAYAPYAFDKNKKLYAPYYFEQQGTNTLQYIENFYDYTTPEYAWFADTLKDGAHFMTPYKGIVSKTVLIEYVVPFCAPEDTQKTKPIGVVFANQSIDHLNHVINTLYLGQSGYWFIVAPNRTYLAHPLSQIVRTQRTIDDVAAMNNIPQLAAAITDVLAGKSVKISYNNEITGAPSWLFCEPLPSIGGAVCRVFDKAEIYATQDRSFSFFDFMRKNLKTISLNMLITCILLLVGIVLWCRQTVLLWWIASLGLAFLFAGEIVYVWYIHIQYPAFKTNMETIHSRSHLFKLLQKYDTAKAAAPTTPVAQQSPYASQKDILLSRFSSTNFVPTGIFINDVSFKSAKEIEISGLIWQQYFTPAHDKIIRGFLLPQASAAKILELERRKYGDTETIIWHVNATLNQQFDYARYPFDVKDIQILIWPREFYKRVTLVPDLTSYVLINSSSRPGLSNSAYLEGWSINGSYFGYKMQTYLNVFGMYKQGAFGVYKETSRSQTPELYFNITIKRPLIDTLTEDLIPLLAISLLLFLILLTSMQQGFAVIASSATVFFGLVVSQLNFREKIPTYQLVYFEYFFLVLYAFTVAVSVISLMYILRVNSHVIQYRNNMISEILYWPVLVFSLLCVTLWYLQ